jgi:hypothetical protein
MLVNEENDNELGFVDLFKKKFSNFCSKAPVLLSFEMDLEGVLVKELNLEKNKYFKFDHSKGVKHNIKIIKDYLIENIYPIMIQEKKEYSDLSVQELEKIINESNISIEDAALMKKEKLTKTIFKIERILVKKDELFVTNLSNNKQYRYKMQMPSTVFLKNLREKWTPEEAYENFEKKSFLLNEIYNNLDVGEDQ